MVAVAGVALATYLTWVHFDAGALVCGIGDCHTVQASEFATVGPFPVAVLGLAMYLTVLACNLIARARPGFTTAVTSIAFAVAFGGAIYAIYLTWLEVAVIGAICQWCVVSALLTLLLAILLGLSVWRGLDVIESDDTETETGAGAAASRISDAPGSGTTGPGQARTVGGRIST